MPTISRRHALLGAAGLGAAVVAATAAPAYAGAARAAAVGASDPSDAEPTDAAPAVPGRSAWLGLIGAPLAATTAAGGILSLTLTAVDDLPHTSSGAEDSYGLIFATPIPVDGIVSFNGVGVGGAAGTDGAPVALYLSPVTQKHRTTAQAVVDRRPA